MSTSTTWRVGKFRVTLAAQMRSESTLELTMTWAPASPQKLTHAERRLYRLGRDRAIRELAQALSPFTTLTH